MSASSGIVPDSPRWVPAACIAVCAHLVGAAGVITGYRSVPPLHADPVVLVELPPADQPDETPLPAAEPMPDPVLAPRAQSRPVSQPPVTPQVESSERAPVEPVREAALAPSPPTEVAPEPVPALQSAVYPEPQAAAQQLALPPPALDARARRQQADYFALVSAHLNRRKAYPAEARKALQQGVVTVRFTVDREGQVSGVSIKQGSGHQILDQVTLELLERVSPLPPMPASMQRDQVTLSLPIEYALRTH